MHYSYSSIFKFSLLKLVIFFAFACSEKEENFFFNKNTKLVLVGENHSYLDKFDANLDLLKQINKELTVKHILIEQPFTTGITIEKFFKTKDSTFLKTFLIKEAENSGKDFKPLYNFYLKLLEYHQNLAADDKFELHFIDAESLKTNNIQTWITLLSETKNENIKRQLEAIEYNPTDYHSTIATVEQLDIISSSKEMLTNHIFKKEILEIKDGFNATNRDSLMFERAKKLISTDSSGVIFGQFGAWHIDANNPNNFYNLLLDLSTNKSDNFIKTFKLIPNCDDSISNFTTFDEKIQKNPKEENFDFSYYISSEKGDFLR